ISGHQRPRSGRKPLQPKNSWSNPLDTKPNIKAAAAVCFEADENNKENIFSTPVKKECFEIELLDASLAEELSAIREKLERLRIDKERTDEMLRERSLFLDSQMKEIVDRGMLQKQLEIEVDRLFRLREIKLSCTQRPRTPISISAMKKKKIPGHRPISSVTY
ncbi:high mobility group B protein 6-like, partial [Salvia miltiorrhiza]|uniref:high mobility group B protein 6-like n=1 Tax=Salvia miltiorrhiza TaxID=226208 RepID=UPI0025ACD7E0